jgi:ATP-binding cassette subfamily B protein/subfamily B ATP-binding cassette protein MsbA
MRDLLRALKYFRPDAPRIGGAFCLLLASTALNVLKPWPLALIVDHVLGPKPLPHWFGPGAAWGKPALLGGLCIALLLLYLGQAALSAAQNYVSIRVGLDGLARARNEVFSWLQRLSLRYHQGARAGDLIYRASWDTYAIQTLFQQGLMTFVSAVLSLAVMLAVMARMNVYLTLMSLALAPLLALSIKTFGARMRERTALAQQADSRVTTLVQQCIALLPLTQSFTGEEAEAGRFAAQTAEAQRRRLAQHGWELIYWFAIAVLFGVGAAAITWLGAVEVAAGHLTVGELLVFLAYLTQLFEPLNQLSHVGATVAGARAGVRRVFEILDTPEEVKDRPEARPIAGRTAGTISFEGVTFGYEKGRDVLREICVTVKSGESVAIIGPSGAGKTTLLHLLPRFFDPVAGAIKLDGVDLRDYRLKDLRRQVALVSQEPVLFPGTVAENIRFGRPGASDKEIEAAARAANADGFIQKLAGRYETLVGEGAARLSVGERQRIHLARAFLKDASILLLDEPASALDAESEALIGQSLRELIKGRTTLLVAHRPATVAVMGRALSLRDGRLAECSLAEALQTTTARPSVSGAG